MDWVLRVEGVNLDDTVFNVNAISVLRGASLVLEAFGYELSKELQTAGTPFEPVLLASSQSVFLLKDMDAAAAAGVRQLVEARLTKAQQPSVYHPPFITAQGGDPSDDLHLDMPLEHMTFVTTLVSLARPVTIGPNRAVSASDEAVLAEAMAIARRQAQRAQLARPNLPRSPAARVTSPGAKIRADMQCQIDSNQQVPVTNEPGACVWVPEGRYKGAKRIEGTDAGPSLRLFSRRSAHLLKYGRSGRKQLYDFMVEKARYQDLMDRGLDWRFSFSESFSDITDTANIGLDLAPSLGGKLAVLYIDGNSFGSKAAERPVAFSAAVKKFYADLFFTVVGQFLDGAQGAQPHVWHNPNIRVRKVLEHRVAMLPPLRIETLFVGGDDACLIFPAWLAFDMTELALSTLRQSAAQHAPEFKATFRSGLAIADSGTPFRRIRNLAYALMNDAKKAFPPRDTDKDTSLDAVSIAILECQSARKPDPLSAPNFDPLCSVEIRA